MERERDEFLVTEGRCHSANGGSIRESDWEKRTSRSVTLDPFIPLNAGSNASSHRVWNDGIRTWRSMREKVILEV